MRRYIYAFCLFCFAMNAFPQVAVLPTDSIGETVATLADSTAERIKAFGDSLNALNERFDHWRYEEADTLSNPYYFYVFSSPTYYGTPMHGHMGQLSYVPPCIRPRLPATSIYDGSLGLQPRLDMTDDALAFIYTRRPWLVRHMDSDTPHSHTGGVPQEVRPPLNLTENVERKPEVKEPVTAEAPDIEVRRPNFWTFNADLSFQLIQNYVSGNWYKGGESNHSLLSNIVLKANYNNKQKVKWDNTLEMKLGFQSSHSDDAHKYKTNSDLIRLTNELGLKATKHWFYSVMLQSWTQFYHGYKKNDPKIYSDFMSPFESLLTIGMKFTAETKNKNFNVSVNISPLAGDFKYVGRLGLSTSYGLAEGRHTHWEYGSNITATHMWRPMKNVKWSGRFYYYTNSKKAQIEWENTIDLTINKYLTTQVFLYPRFDDSVTRKEPNQSYLQFKEYLSLGVKLSF